MQEGLPNLSTKGYLFPKYDLWSEAIHLTTILTFPIQWQQIKVYQDDIKISRLLIYRPITATATATVNVLCDKQATSASKNPIPERTSSFHMNTAKPSLTIKNQRIHIYTNLYILQAYHTSDNKEYIREHTGCNNHTFQLVDWTNLEIYIYEHRKKYSANKCSQILT